MLSFFADQNYSDPTATALDNNSRLALHITLFLRETQQRPDGCWAGQHMGAKLRHTCHAIEALHLLQWQAYKGQIELGLDWLLNLPDPAAHFDDEQEKFQYHPSRFKTLAWLGHFQNRAVLDDFEELGSHIRQDGLLYNVIDKQILGSIIYADCLTLLQPGEIMPAWQRNQTLVLAAVRGELTNWCRRRNGEETTSLITTLSDASYAVDILLRSGDDALTSTIVEQIYQEICAHIENAPSLGYLSSDILYCVIQLATHFGDRPKARIVLDQFFANLRMYYDRRELANDKRIAMLHPLVLRAMLSYGGKELCDHMLARLLNREREAINQAKSAADSRMVEFEALIRQKTRITIVKAEMLSGGISDAQIYRLHYELAIESLLEPTESNRAKLTPPSVVVRADSPEAIHRAVYLYQRLPAKIQHLFAQHAGEPTIFEAEMDARAFLILEDLTNTYSTFRDFFDRIDRAHISNENREKLHRACRTLVRELRILYTETKKENNEFVGTQLSRLYFSGFERYLIRLGRPGYFPRLKPFFDGFWLADAKHFSSFEYYQSRIDHHKEKLKIVRLMTVHGDFHARNVMLDECQDTLKLIDLDKLEENGDYILDFAQLLEDIAAFRFIFDENNRQYLRTDTIDFGSGQNHITYPPFGTDATRLFQEWLLAEIAAFADAIEDVNWKQRFWLGTAMHLMSLINKQHDVQHAAVLYVEAVRLLDELVQSLDSQTALPAIPFRAEHPIDDFPSAADETVQTLLMPLHESILALESTLRHPISVDIKPSGKMMRYFLDKETRPVIVIDGKKNPPKVLLGGDQQGIDDPRGLLQETAGGGFFQRYINVDKPADIQYVADIVAQLLRQMIPSNGH